MIEVFFVLLRVILFRLDGFFIDSGVEFLDYELFTFYDIFLDMGYGNFLYYIDYYFNFIIAL